MPFFHYFTERFILTNLLYFLEFLSYLLLNVCTYLLYDLVDQICYLLLGILRIRDIVLDCQLMNRHSEAPQIQ